MGAALGLPSPPNSHRANGPTIRPTSATTFTHADERGNHYLVAEYELPHTHQQRTILYRIEPNGTCRKVLDGLSVDHEKDHVLGHFERKVERGVLRHYLNGKPYREIPLD